MDFRIIQKVGHGGMGEVYEARRPMANDEEWPIAIKMVHALVPVKEECQ